MAEKSQAVYLKLACGHYCPKEVAVIYSVFGNSVGVWCEHDNCGAFRKVVKAKPNVTDTSLDVPLF